MTTPLLGFLAGEHAPAIANLWPAPHTGFLAMPAPRRHASAMLASWGRAKSQQGTDLVRLVERGRDSEVAAQLCGGDAPFPGLMKALGRLGERLWTLESYDKFMELFGDDRSARIVRHMAEIDVERLEFVHMLPPRLREAKIVEKLPSKAAVSDLSKAFRLAVLLRGGKDAEKIATRWERAKDAKRLFEMAAEDLAPIAFTAPPRPPTLPPVFLPVSSRKMLVEVALKFKNCLRDFTSDIAYGRMAVYVWQGQPNVVLALRCDAAGWRLAEAELADNEDAPEALLRDVTADLVKHGVRLGVATSTLARRLPNYANGYDNYNPVDEDTWVGHLELSDLWD